MLFSLIVPVYNRKNTITRCIVSILKQKCQDYEVIIIDDGSFDGTEKICEKFSRAYEKIQVWHQNNQGVSVARNIGIGKASGEYVVFIDSDDAISSNYLSDIKEAYEKYGDEVIYCTSMKVIKKEGIQYYRYRNSQYSFAGMKDIMVLMNEGLLNSPCNKVYSRRILIENNIKFPQKVSLGEDLIFNYRYLDRVNRVRFLFLNQTYYHVYAGKDSLERRWREDFFDVQIVLLHEGLRYLCKWQKNGRLNCKRQEEYECMKQNLYWNYVMGSINYYITFEGKMPCWSVIKKINEIKKTPEYLKCMKLNGKKRVETEIFTMGIARKRRGKECVKKHH